jgi:transcriptional regulator with PAS, ATPase and Fis domain
VTGLAPDLLDFFKAYDWPGNIREFRNVLEGMVVLATDDILQKADLPPEMLRAPQRQTGKKLSDNIAPGVSLEEYEKAIIMKNLLFHHGNREKTAASLGISERTLYRKIKDFNLDA